MQVLHQLPHTKDKDLLVGIDTSDDAAVYRISEDLAAVTSLDFFPPIVDDPHTFGQIAASNALSDIYAMGGSPRFATNIVCFPKALDLDILAEIIKGSMEKLNEAGVLLVGGHSVEDREVKYGLSVTGFINPRDITTNKGARAGDVLVLTKPIGVGVITSAIKAGKYTEEAAEEAFAAMKTLNREASEAMVSVGANACTDITGFGLLGHAFEVAQASGVSMVIRSREVAVFPGAMELVKKKKNRPRAIETNKNFLKRNAQISEKVNPNLELILYDPQTSGGLLISVSRENEERLIEKLRDRSIKAGTIGNVIERRDGCVIRVE
jgi:selenide,water dikinase